MRGWLDTRRGRSSTPQRMRLLLAVGSVWFLALGGAYALDAMSQAVLPWLWPALFFAAGVLVACYDVWPTSTWLFKWAGMAGYVALGSQWVRVVTNLFSDGLDTHDWSRVAGVLIWIGFAFTWRKCWVNGVGRFYDDQRYGVP